MKKVLRKVLTTALASVMALGTVLAIDVTEAKADGAVAKFSLADADWSYQVWGDKEGSTATVTGAGSYSMELLPYEATAEDGTKSTATPEGAAVFVVDIEFGKDALLAQNYAVSELKLTVDGADFAIDTTKIVYGDLESKGNFRIELFNQWGPTAVGEKYDAAVTPFDPATLKATQSIKIDFTLVETDNPVYGEDEKGIQYVGLNGDAAAGGDKVEVPEFDPSGKYNAYIGFQTPSWSFRNEWYEEKYGKHTEYFNQATGWDGDVAIKKDGVITDAVIDGNGTYRVSLTEIGTWMADEINASADGIFNVLFISTDIPADADVEITDVKLIIDGSTKHKDATAFLNPDAKDYINILIQNIWNEEKKEISFYSAPTKSLEMEFTISGFDHDNESQKEEVTTTPAAKDDNKGDDKGGLNPAVIVIAVVAVVAIVAVVAVLVLKKKKN